MTNPTSQPRARGSASVYAPLASRPKGILPKPGGSTAPADPAARLAVEAERLELIKTALWEAFLAFPMAAIPLPLVELATAYLSLLKVQLTLTAGAPRARPRSGGHRQPISDQSAARQP